MDHQFKEDRKMVPRLNISSISPKKKNISSTYLISITSLPEDEQTSKHGGEVGTMQFRVQGEQIKKRKRKKSEYKERKKDENRKT
jgi:hypothetical protein